MMKYEKGEGDDIGSTTYIRKGDVILISIGIVMGMMVPFMIFAQVFPGETEWVTIITPDQTLLTFLCHWLVVIFSVLSFTFLLAALVLKRATFAWWIGLSGMATLLLPGIYIMQTGTPMISYTESVKIYYTGGILSIISGIITSICGIRLATNIKQIYPGKTQSPMESENDEIDYGDSGETFVDPGEDGPLTDQVNEREPETEKAASQCNLSFDVVVPQHIETDTTAEIVIQLRNPTRVELNQISIDLTDLKSDFFVEGEIKVERLRPNAEVEGSVRIRPKYKKGIFPVTIKITANEHTYERDYTIKVGGTEIY